MLGLEGAGSPALKREDLEGRSPVPILRWPPDAESLSRTNRDLLFQKEACPAHSVSPEAEALAGRGGDGSRVCRAGCSPLSTLSHKQCPAKQTAWFPFGGQQKELRMVFRVPQIPFPSSA